MLKNNTGLFLVLAVLLGLVTGWFFNYRYQIAAPYFLYFSYLMFALLAIGSHHMLKKAAGEKESYTFVNTYLGITAVKIFLVLSVLTIYLYFNKAHLFAVGIFYAFAYLLYLGFEVSLLLKMLRIRD